MKIMALWLVVWAGIAACKVRVGDGDGPYPRVRVTCRDGERVTFDMAGRFEIRRLNAALLIHNQWLDPPSYQIPTHVDTAPFDPDKGDMYLEGRCEVAEIPAAEPAAP